MMYPSSFTPHQQGTHRTRIAKGAADFLRAHDKMASILPTVTRMAELQKDCAAALPTMFESCVVLLFDAGQLVLATPNAALAAKLKQQLPKLQDSLLKRGWQVSAIRLKVQVTKILVKSIPSKQLSLPAQAVSALAALGNTLENSPRNEALKAALTAMVQRHLGIK